MENCALFNTSLRYINKMKIRLELILVITITVLLTTNQAYASSFMQKSAGLDKSSENAGDESMEEHSVNLNSNKETVSSGQEINTDNYVDTFGNEIYTSFNEAIGDFSPEVNIEGEFSSELKEGELREGSTNLDLAGEGEYDVKGTIANLQTQYIQNPSAESSEMFYSDSAVQVGLSLDKLKDNRSLEGEYVWKFYAQNIESMAYALYQEDLVFYNNDTTISYSYLLESNSSLQYVINSSVIMDLVFDTCRIMIIHWHYTNLEPPLIGENTTTPFVVYRLLQNSSWDDQWYNYSLSIYDLFDKTDPYIPTTLKSAGIYALSPEDSDCSLLIDNFKVKTSVEPNDINLTINNNPVNTIGVGEGSFNYHEIIAMENYLIIWDYNSSYVLNGDYSIYANGSVNIDGESNITLVDETFSKNVITIKNLSSTVEFVNITYPNLWEIDDNITGCSVLLNDNITTTIAKASIQRVDFEINIVIEFKIPNLVQSSHFEENTIFEQINGTIDFNQPIENPFIHIFWYGSNNGSRTIKIDENKLIFTFPSSLLVEEYEVILLIMEDNFLGYINETFSLTRIPSTITTISKLELPIYSLKTINIDYASINPEVNIEEGRVRANINDEIVNTKYEENYFLLQVSALYLEEGNYSISILAQSDTHASAFSIVDLTVVDGNIDIAFNYKKQEKSVNYKLLFNVTTNLVPIGYAPVILNLNNETTISGVTDENGYYSCEITIIPTTNQYSVSLAIIKAQNILSTEHFLMEFENLQVSIQRCEDEVIIADNVTLTYIINYPTTSDKWFATISQEMLPIFDAYIETNSLRIPVIWDENMLFWDYFADNKTLDHKLIIQTTGPKTQVYIEEEEDTITLYITIDSENKLFNNLSFIYYLNNSYTTEKYEWKLFVNKINDVTEKYNLEVNNLYVYFTNINLVQGSILVLDLTGLKTSNLNIFRNVVIPVLSSSGITLGVITTIVKIYNKKKGMILEI